MINFLAHNDEIRQEILESISIASIEDLFKAIPKQARMSELNFGEALSEMQTQKKVKSLAKKNNIDFINFLGAGVYNHFSPACIAQVAQRFEFLTAYTPYQPEISQGTLQIMYEYQSMICNLTGMDVSNAGVYDGATACAEAVLMASRITGKDKILTLDTMNPQYLQVVKTYCDASGLELEVLHHPELVSGSIQLENYACLLIQTPNYKGEILELNNLIKSDKMLLIACVNITSLSVMEPPKADIIVGDIQPLGIGMNFGGPHGGFMACREKFMRQLPGRIAGRTLDADENQAFTLTIQTREQHIKREKATSNICSNQALITLCATLYLSLLGEKGFRQVGILSNKNAHELSQKLASKGVKTINKNFFNEFVIEIDDADKFLAKLEQNGILGGLKLDKNQILVATTEMISSEDIDLYVSLV